MPGAVESLEQVRFADITAEQAALEGCTAVQLRTLLSSEYYPGIVDDDIVDFVRFRITGPALTSA